MESIPFAHNLSNARFIYAKMKEKIMEGLFELQTEEAIHISNHSEADHTARILATKVLEQLDNWDYVTWLENDTLDKVIYDKNPDIEKLVDSLSIKPASLRRPKDE